MNQNPLEQELREKAWRRALTAKERAQLAALLAQDSKARADWEADVALSAALARLTEKPAPSNLTARVLAEIERETLTTAKARKTNRLGWLGSWGWVPRLAVVIGFLCCGAFALHRQKQLAREKTAHNMAAVATAVQPLPAEVLEEFDTISSLPPPLPGADLELLALMK